MTKDVLITVSGTQFGPDTDGDPVEIITGGTYYKRNGKHYLLYDELVDENHNVNKNRAKFNENMFTLTKSGITNTNMVFELNKKNLTNYITPFGALLIGIEATAINVQESEERITVQIDYGLDINYEHLANCQIRMEITAKDSKMFTLGRGTK